MRKREWRRVGTRKKADEKSADSTRFNAQCIHSTADFDHRLGGCFVTFLFHFVIDFVIKLIKLFGVMIIELFVVISVEFEVIVEMSEGGIELTEVMRRKMIASLMVICVGTISLSTCKRWKVRRMKKGIR